MRIISVSLLILGFLLLASSCNKKNPEIYGKWRLVESRISSSGKTISSAERQGTVEAIFATNGVFTTTFKGQRVNFFSFTIENNELIIDGQKTEFKIKKDTLFLVTNKTQGIVYVYVPSTSY